MNMGKGHAVRYGMAKAKGDIIGFIDAGLELNPNGLSMLLEHFEWYKADIIIGSKRHPASHVIYPWQRKILSFGYQMIVRILFGLKVRDTQVGMKFFKREVLEKVMPRVLVKAFAFDVEMLAVANYLGFKRIYEAPVEMKMKFQVGLSTIASKGFMKTALGMFWDTLAVFYRLKILHYYDDKNKKNWITPTYLVLSN
jgi:glycosyltransferase involved in cell wall biosynthesis